jgi:hypothetical protein
MPVRTKPVLSNCVTNIGIIQIQRSGFDSRLYQIFWGVVGLERGRPVGILRSRTQATELIKNWQQCYIFSWIKFVVRVRVMLRPTVSSTYVRLNTKCLLMWSSCWSVVIGRPLWREDWSVWMTFRISDIKDKVSMSWCRAPSESHDQMFVTVMSSSDIYINSVRTSQETHNLPLQIPTG